MDIFTYGVTTSRYQTTLIWDKNKLLTPIGSNLSIWDLDTLQREKVLPYNTNSVMSLIENTHFIFSVAYNCEVCVLDKYTLQLITTVKSEGRCVRHATVTEDYLAVSAEEGPDNCKGVTTVYSLEGLKAQTKEIKLETMLVLKGRYRFCHVLEGGKLFTTRENILNEKERQDWRELRKINPDISKDSKPKKKFNYALLLYDIKTKNLELEKDANHQSTIISSQSNKADLLNLMYLDRQFITLNPYTLEIHLNTKVAGTGAILATELTERSTFFSPKSGILVRIHHDKTKNFPDCLEYEKQIEGMSVYKLPGTGIDQKIYCFLLKDENTGIICFEDGINIIDLVSNKTKSISCFNITCCGLALSSTSDLIACGDFTGNVHIFPTNPALCMEPFARTFIMESVRTLTFDSTNESVIIGTLSGKLLRWWIQDPSEPKPVATFEDGVLNIRYNYHNDGHKYLIVGLANGMFAILKEIELEHNMLFILGHYGHRPSTLPRNPDFGSLHKYAEIWSTVWSASSNQHFVTASEDQSCCVWDVTQKNPSLAHKLVGHTKAVTSVDWRVMDPVLGELFISCSDDQTARVYDPKDSFKLLFVISTSFIKEWHTLTYLALEEGGTRVAIGAQNGFLFVYDLLKREFIFAERIHNGSVEGLDWKGNSIVTCSADNSISVIRPPKHVSPPKL